MNAIRCPIKELCFDYNLFGSCNDCKINKEINKCHKQIKRLKKQNETLTIQRNAWALAAERVAEDRKWISVNDRLPEKEGTYLIFTDIHFIPDHVDDCDHYEGVEISNFSPRYGFYSENGLYARFWMPLPEPPKESEED